MKVLEIIKQMKRAIQKDFQNFDRKNVNEQAVLDAKLFSCYKGTFVLKLPIGSYAASFGILFVGNKATQANTIRHEYGHRLQWERMKLWEYIKRVAIPSFTINLLERRGRLPYDYYSYPWEAEADRLGGVSGRTYKASFFPGGRYSVKADLRRLFFKRQEVL